jgi:hypothetical protein
MTVEALSPGDAAELAGFGRRDSLSRLFRRFIGRLSRLSYLGHTSISHKSLP